MFQCCHGSPRSDEEIITHLTPESAMTRLLIGVHAQVVVCGHTHVQFDRQAAGKRIVNSGSVGMPYQGKPGAYWALLGPGVEMRRTVYDFERAAKAAQASGFPDEQFSTGKLYFSPLQPDDAARFFEEVAAKRGER